MRAAWRAADVRAAEEELMSALSHHGALSEHALMQRAATGLARRCASLLAESGGIYGRRVLLLVGAGNNGGDALFAGAALAGRGAVVDALLLSPDRVHRGGLGALRAAGGSVVDPSTPTSTWSWTASSASARRGPCGAPRRSWSRGFPTFVPPPGNRLWS